MNVKHHCEECGHFRKFKTDARMGECGLLTYDTEPHNHKIVYTRYTCKGYEPQKSKQ